MLLGRPMCAPRPSSSFGWKIKTIYFRYVCVDHPLDDKHSEHQTQQKTVSACAIHIVYEVAACKKPHKTIWNENFTAPRTFWWSKKNGYTRFTPRYHTNSIHTDLAEPERPFRVREVGILFIHPQRRQSYALLDQTTMGCFGVANNFRNIFLGVSTTLYFIVNILLNTNFVWFSHMVV